MTAATIKLIEAVERLNMTGEIGDGMVANLHELAGLARLEIARYAPPIPSLSDLLNQPVLPTAADFINHTHEQIRTERELVSARNAHDGSTFAGRQRLSAAQAAYHKAREHPLRAVSEGRDRSLEPEPARCRHPFSAFDNGQCGRCGEFLGSAAECEPSRRW